MLKEPLAPREAASVVSGTTLTELRCTSTLRCSLITVSAWESLHRRSSAVDRIGIHVFLATVVHDVDHGLFALMVDDRTAEAWQTSGANVKHRVGSISCRVYGVGCSACLVYASESIATLRVHFVCLTPLTIFTVRVRSLAAFFCVLKWVALCGWHLVNVPGSRVVRGVGPPVTSPSLTPLRLGLVWWRLLMWCVVRHDRRDEFLCCGRCSLFTVGTRVAKEWRRYFASLRARCWSPVHPLAEQTCDLQADLDKVGFVAVIVPTKMITY